QAGTFGGMGGAEEHLENPVLELGFNSFSIVLDDDLHSITFQDRKNLNDRIVTLELFLKLDGVGQYIIQNDFESHLVALNLIHPDPAHVDLDSLKPLAVSQTLKNFRK